MNDQIVKTGSGILWGVSNDSDQPGKTVTIFDGEVTICQFQLVQAFTGRAAFEPGARLDVKFVTNLRVQTDGTARLHWFADGESMITQCEGTKATSTNALNY